MNILNEIRLSTSRAERILLVILTLLNLILAGLLLCKHQFNLRLFIQPSIESVTYEKVMVDYDIVRDYDVELEKVPKVILQCFMGTGWQIVTDPEVVATKEYTNEHWGGYTNYGEKEIVVISDGSLVHEFGHYLSWALNFPRYQSEVYIDEHKEVSKFIGSYAATNSREYFACYFNFWLKADDEDKAIAKELGPKTYAYFEELENNDWGLSTEQVWVQQLNWVSIQDLYDLWEYESNASKG